MGKKEIVDLMIDGGAAKAGAALGTKLGPLGVNMGQVIQKINEETAVFTGIKVPVKLIVDIDTKKFEIEVGTPPTSQLILSELKLKKGSGKTKNESVGNLSKEQFEKISKMKQKSSLSRELKGVMNEVRGTCVSMGITIEGKNPKEYKIQ